jgi:hypothetical protein
MENLVLKDQQESLDLQALLDATATKDRSVILDNLAFKAQWDCR